MASSKQCYFRSRWESKLHVIVRSKNWKRTVQNHRLQTEFLPEEEAVIMSSLNC